MWPFNKKANATPQTMPPGEISFSQVDITESFGDNLRLKPEDWITTVPLNKTTPNGRGLPPVDASGESVYEFASGFPSLESLSLFRTTAFTARFGILQALISQSYAGLVRSAGERYRS